MCYSFGQLSNFLRKQREYREGKGVEEGKEEEEDRLSMVREGLPALYFRCSEEFVQRAVVLCLEA